jgi:membrane protease YdiL (CAAX protease family)
MRTIEDLLIPVMRPLTVPDFVVISLLAGAGEEGVFRGILQGYLSGVMGEVPALIAAAALFGLLHFITPLYAVLATLMGLYLGWLFLATGNLVVPMIVHALYDLAALLYLVRLRHNRGGAPEERGSA